MYFILLYIIIRFSLYLFIFISMVYVGNLNILSYVIFVILNIKLILYTYIKLILYFILYISINLHFILWYLHIFVYIFHSISNKMCLNLNYTWFIPAIHYVLYYTLFCFKQDISKLDLYSYLIHLCSLLY